MQNSTKWDCFKGFAIPNNAPHGIVDTTEINNKSFWSDVRAVAARWTSDFDINQETNWWYIIKDSPFDISAIKAKRRYEITKGMRNFDVRIIDPTEYREELYDVFQRSMTGYPKKYRNKNDRKDFYSFIDRISKKRDIQIIYGAFYKENNKLCGYIHIPTYKDWAAMSSLRTDPEYERKGINAAIIYQILLDYNDRLVGEFYICDGQRTINHKTNFQDYLEKYFMFRKAYCKLHIKYSPVMKTTVAIVKSFKRILKSLDFIDIAHLINSLIMMDEYAEKQ